MRVRVCVQNTPKCLRHGDDPGTGFWVTGGFAQQLVDGLIRKAHEISEQIASVHEIRSEHFWNRESPQAMSPEKYRGGMFLAFHGSWNRADRIGYEVTFIPFSEGKPLSGPEAFLGGWMLDPTKREVWGRPVGLLQLPDGSLLVTDDGGKKIWRFTYGS